MKLNISKTFVNYGIKRKIFEDFQIEFEESKITSIVAPFKTGKSLLLKILAGIEQNDEKLEPIQNSFLITSEPMSFPWMNLKQTLLFANKNLDENKIIEIAKIVGLEGYENHYPHNKSLGYRFRIALATAIAKNSKLILIDESFQNMEQITKYELYQLLIDLNKKNNIGFIVGTSNLHEAILLSDEIILLKNIPHKTYNKFIVNHSSQKIEERIKSEAFISTNQKLINVINQEDLNQNFNFIL